MWVAQNGRVRSGYECCCYCCCVCALCFTAIMRRLSQSTPCAWGVLCGVRVAWSHAPEPRARSFFSLTARVCSKNKNSTQSTRVSPCRSSPQNIRRCQRCCICPLPRLRRVTLPAFGGLALALPRRTGHAFGGVRVVAWCGANHLPCDVRTDVT